MFNLEQMEAHLTDAVKQAVKAEAHRLQGGIAVNELIASTLAKPVLRFPDDVQLVLGVGRTTAFEVAKDPRFPALTEIGKRRFLDTGQFLRFMGAQVAS